MDKGRMNEIAYALLKAKVKHSGIKLIIKRELPDIVAESGIPQPELLQFARQLSHELIDECF